MKEKTYETLCALGYKGVQDAAAPTVIRWLSDSDLLRIEPYWRFLGADGGYSWTRSWDEFSDRREVSCETWEELLEFALEQSLEEAFPNL